MGKTNDKQSRQAPIAELLEPRVLFSADSLSVLGGALLPDELVDSNALFDYYDELDPTSNNIDSNNVEVVFIDSRVPEVQSIIDDIADNNSSSITIVIIDQSDSGIDVVQNTLASLENVNSVHLVSHSFGSTVRLGSDLLSTSSLSEQSESIAAWGKQLSEDADLLLYGCDLGSSVDGIKLMHELAELTSADVAVSSDYTGHSSLGGNWVLEHSSGQIETDVFASATFQGDWGHALAGPWNSVDRVFEVTYKQDQYLNDTSSIDNLIADASNNSREISLREAIAAINNENALPSDLDNITIKLDAGQYLLNLYDPSGDEDNSVTGDLDINHNLTIEGAGSNSTTLLADANDNDGDDNHLRVLDAHQINLRLTGITISGGYTDENGAGLYLEQTPVVLTDVAFSRNESKSGDGGAIYSDGGASITMTGGGFYQNKVHNGDGGGLLVDSGPQVTLTDVVFQENTALDGKGGAIHTFADMLLVDSLMNNQNSAKDGGGVYVNGSANVTAQNSQIEDNRASDDGGGVYVEGTFSLNDKSTLALNEAGKSGGGAYLHSGASMYAHKSTVHLNQALSGNGGGVHMVDSSLDVHNAIISFNEAYLGDGGGINVDGVIEITNSTVTENKAENGAGIYLEDDGATGPLTENTTFFRNQASIDGGAIAIKKGHLYLKNNTIAENTATELGSAIAIVGNDATATLKNSIVSQNNSSDASDPTDFEHYQLADKHDGDGFVSEGFNVITRDVRAEELYFKDSVLINDIIQIDGTHFGSDHRENMQVNADLSANLIALPGLHSTHLQLGPDSDAIDAGGGDPRKDGYGIMSNEFVDAGAAESLEGTQGSKLFWIDSTDSSVYRMNAGGQALQQIIQSPVYNHEYSPGNFIPIPQEFKDIAYDHKSGQLFILSYTNIPVFPDAFTIGYSNADGAITADSYLSLGGINPSGTRLDAENYASYAIAIEETADPDADNVLFISLHRYSDDDFQLVKYVIQDGADPWAGGPTVVTPGSSGTSDGIVSSLSVAQDSNSTTESFFGWGETNNGTSTEFNRYETNANMLFNIPVTGTNAGESTRGVDFGTADEFYLSSVNKIEKRDMLLDSIAATLMLPVGAAEFSDIEVDNTNELLWYVDKGTGTGGTIGSVNKGLTDPSTPIVLEQAPISLTLATLSTVNTPLRPTTPNTLTLPENSSRDIDSSSLYYENTNVSEVTPATDIVYTIEKLPVHGVLNIDGTPAILTDTFTQSELDTVPGRLSYTQTGDEVVADSFTFTVSDSSTDTPDLDGTFDFVITEANDAPTLTVNNAVASITEMDVNTVLAQVTVADVDSPTPQIVVTDIPGGSTASPYVLVQGNNLVLNPSANIDAETIASFSYTVHSIDDQGLKSAEQTFTVAITNVNEAPTMTVTNAVTSITEMDTNTVLAQVSVADVDSPTPQIVVTDVPGGTVASPYVLVQGNDLVLNPSANIDAETVPSFSYTVHSIDDQGLKSAEQTFTVAITNINEAPTMAVTNAVTSITEMDTNTVLAEVSVADVDSPTPQIVVTDVPGGTVASPYVLVQGNDLVLNPSANIDAETVPSFSYTVHTIDDDGLKSAEQTFTVAITNINEAPTMTVTNAVTSITEMDENTVLAEVTVADVDNPTPQIVVTDIPGGSTASPYVLVQGNNLVLNPSANIDAETIASFSYTVHTIDDDGLKSAEQTFTVAITNINEAPTMTVTNAVTSITEMDTNTVLAQVSVADVDSPTPQIVVTDVPGGTVASPYVLVQGNDLVLNPSANIDAETIASFSYTVHSIDDQGLKSAEQTFTVAITNVNEAPTMTVTNAVTSITEMDENTVLAEVTVADVDSPTSQIIVTDAPNSTTPSPYVLVQGNDLVLNPSANIDAETVPSFSYTVHTIDDDGLKSAEQTFTVAITNVNEAPTMTVTNAVASITEMDENTVLAEVTVADVDSPTPQIVVTDIPGGSTASPYVLVQGNNLVLNPSANIDAETIASFSYTVHTIDDDGLKSAEQTFTVAITNINEAPTMTVTNAVTSITEMDTNTVLAQVSVADVDSPTPQIVVTDVPGGTVASPYVLVQGNDLVLNPSANIDAETIASFSYTVHSIDDQGLKSAEQTFTVAITNVNEAPTMTVTNAVTSITEMDENTVLAEVTVADVDSPTSQIIVTDAPNSTTPSPYVLVQGNDLVLNPSANIDAETVPSFSYTVHTIDDDGLKSAEQTFTVAITNVNEAPTMTVTNAVASITEMDENTVLAEVTVADVDSPTPQIIVTDAPNSTTPSPYVLVQGNDLVLNPSANIDAETVASFSYTVHSIDDDGLKSAEQTFTVAITNVNEAPTMTVTNAVTSITEMDENTVLAEVTVADVDSPTPQIVVTDAPNSTTPSPYVLVQGNDLVLNPSAVIDFEVIKFFTYYVHTVDDQSLSSPKQAFTVAIDNVNEAPFIADAIDAEVELIGSTVDLSKVSFIDPENDTLSLNLILSGTYTANPETGEQILNQRPSSNSPLPEWVNFDPITKIITITNAPDAIDRVEFQLIADDGKGGRSLPQIIYVDLPDAPELGAVQEMPESEPEPAPEPEAQISEPEETDLSPIIISQAIPPETTPVETEGDNQKNPAELNEDLQTDEADQSIDLASLIQPLEKVSFIELEANDNSLSSISRKINITQLDNLESSINWLNLSDAFSQPSDVEFNELANEFDRQREELAERAANNKTVIGSSFTLSSGLSVGYLLWLIRGGTLMGSVLSSLPAWRLVDPLPVLGSLGDDFDDDQETLESMVDQDDHEAHNNSDKPPAQAA